MNAAGFQVQLYSQSAGGPVHWRLLSGNNRECGRSARGYADERSCRQGVARLQAQAQELAVRVRRVDPNRWIWELHYAERPVATAAHAFDRLIRCDQALSQFMVNLPDARVCEDVVVFGARRWGSAAS
ncbi:DUF1508 domain-containing protein [uncultured Jatrophihabitans sp.]|uniref:DUF1508 domain-containing protein n=1 Tax=uncultured Jatrophihabitans sp. TaxID=1610747 RepID=UPI0035CC72A5